MSYDDIRGIGGAIGLTLLFVGFIGVVIYALWPGNRGRFRHAAQIPLDDSGPDPESRDSGRDSGRDSDSHDSDDRGPRRNEKGV